ncbi:MAG: imidazole glycerol phosphate synthase subunit HisH [Phycisphaerae bacterium]|nr:imidazole glycerol phosphate synthase subunit HisH [Phycisphaerae bacterium]
MPFMLIVIDYSVGNVKSVCNAFRHIGCEAKLSCKPQDIKAAAGLVLPGVAAFGYAVSALGPLAELIKELALAGKPLLGICVGYQMLFDRSSEYGPHKGLGLIAGNVVPVPSSQTVPHMGWNLVKLPEDMDLFTGLPKEKHFYFAHSFYADVADTKTEIAYTDYGFQLPASVQKGTIYGTQFHPEKSGPVGLKVLENFSKICQRKSI